MRFRTELGATVFAQKYANFLGQTWDQKAEDLASIVVAAHERSRGHIDDTAYQLQAHVFNAISEMKFIPGGRYIYYAGRPAHFYNNCFLFKSTADTREAWATLMSDVTASLMSGGGVGNDYSIFRPKGSILNRTGGTASGAIPLMRMVNEAGRNVMQGGSRRSAIYASLNWKHGDIQDFLKAKNWEDQYVKGAYTKDGRPFSIKDAKEHDFNYNAPLDMTNISINYDTEWLNYTWPHGVGNGDPVLHKTFLENVKQAMKNGEPGFSFNFFENEDETARNACTEVTSADDGDVCNLGSLNLANINTIQEFEKMVEIATKFLLCGTIVGDLPVKKIEEVRTKNRRLGLGLMGVHEWLLKRGYRYEVTSELREWLEVYRDVSDHTAKDFSDKLHVSNPVKVRAIAPTGTIGIVAGTTTGIEPIYAVAYKRRFLVDGEKWKYQYCVDATAKSIIDANKIDPDEIETANHLARNPERRIKFQADVQDYVDMSISSTLNLPSWGGDVNNNMSVSHFANILAKYAHRLRGMTFYPDGSRGGQPITECAYEQALQYEGVTLEDNDNCKGGVCGL